MHSTQQTTAPDTITSEAPETTGITSPFIERLVAEQIAREQTEADAAKERAEAVEQTACEQQAGAFRALIEDWLDEEWRGDLQVRVHAPTTWQDQPRALLIYHGEWIIEPHDEAFKLVTPDNYTAATFSKLDSAQQVWQKMLAGFAGYDQRIASDAQRQAENHAAYAQRQAEQTSAATAAREEHAACEAEIAVARTAATAAQWQWPEGRSIVVYRWTWQSGHTEDGKAITSYGWSRPTDILDPLHLQATRHHGERRIHLRDEVHLPVAEERTFASIAELPDELTTTTAITVDGIWHGYSHELEQMAYGRGTGSQAVITLTPEPLAWIRELVETRFNSTHPHPFDEIPF